jgi:signal transduction histidine kinase
LLNLSERINSKILLKITFLVIIEIILIVASFIVLAYFQSQQSSLGNSINIAGKNRYLTANLLLQSEKYLYGLSSDSSQLKVAMNSLESNIIALKQGGMISGIDLKPLPSNILDLWNTVDGKWNVFKTYVTNKLLTPPQARTTMDQSLTRKVFESMASNLVESSNKLVTLLGQQTDKNSQNQVLLQILFAILIVGILVLILYIVARMLKPIFVLTQATSKVEKGNLDIIIRNAKRLLRLEQNILDMARIDSQSLKLMREKFDLIEKIQNVINDFGNGLPNEKIELVFTPSQKEPIFVNADEVRIFEVISNLLSNAVKFTKEGRITINAEKKDTQVLVSIKDPGSGIQPELMPKLFSKYVTNSPLGTGVGLFISKSIIESHGGKIWAENNADAKGATFMFRLPLEC